MTRDVPRFLCVGAAHWDIIARADGPVSIGDDVPGRIVRRPGGVALNVAMGLAGLGCDASLVCAVGNDDEGAALTQEIQRLGVGVDRIAVVDGATDRYLAIEDKHGDLIAAIADARLLDRVASEIADKAIEVLGNVNSVLLDANLPSAEITRIAQRADAQNVEVVVNPVSPAKASRLIELFNASLSPVIVCNLDEANVLAGDRYYTAIDAVAALVQRGTDTALVTAGGGPAAIATPEGAIAQRPPAAPAGSSVTGAGDALLAAFLAFPNRREDPGGALSTALQAAAEKMKENP